jgi:hypothetical protein
MAAPVDTCTLRSPRAADRYCLQRGAMPTHPPFLLIEILMVVVYAEAIFWGLLLFARHMHSVLMAS